MDKAQAAIDLFEATGHIGWYDWAVENWGTKWNANAFHESCDAPEDFEFLFDTAWSPPMPIYQTIAKLFPNLSFEFVGVEEMMDFGYRGSAANGAFYSEFNDGGDDAYHSVFGCYPDSDEFEEEDDEEEVE